MFPGDEIGVGPARRAERLRRVGRLGAGEAAGRIERGVTRKIDLPRRGARLAAIEISAVAGGCRS